ncbi:T9SS type A sorting domain-containing protein [Flavobacterium sp. DGU11]|uniref:T9SS type A sorting domain-containing protein n=1 Tax=Flavobacterium arundinis TaxID=3139143 RepID=A0ABU9HRZ1_9FLAO
MKKITFLVAAAILLVSPNAFSQAKLQAVHNSPDAALTHIDIYMGDIRIIDDMGFREATPFLEIPAGIPLTFTIAPANSTSVADGFYSMTETFNGTYVIVANGIHSTTGYSPAPPFGLRLFSGAFDSTYMPGYTGVLLSHGCTDSGNINVSETSIPLGTFIYDMPYPVFTAGYHSMPVMNYVIEVTTTATNEVLGSYSVPLATMAMDNKAAIVLSSGFAHPENNSNGPAFGLFMVRTEGGSFIPLQSTMGREDYEATAINAYPNPASGIVTLELPSSATVIEGSLYDLSGREVLRISGTDKMDVSGLSNGIFMLNATADGKSFTKKIIVNH